MQEHGLSKYMSVLFELVRDVFRGSGDASLETDSDEAFRPMVCHRASVEEALKYLRSVGCRQIFQLVKH